MILSNEFAAVEISLDTRANGPRLRIADLSRASREAFFDPLLLETLVGVDPDELARLSRPDRIAGDGPAIRDYR
jgi:hypothetical protein